ncbi:hypothetical protein TeGR_g6175 [Tetraparma gracilis]|uniref:Uncharacterized protein n=1 Tax=Tetraparma gracilis TaxID=2962635 RepID=A0ABQ6M7N9_9STRA|nr:hypothetical protein TeGR_g6175 [Tetraparma gracilis]
MPAEGSTVMVNWGSKCLPSEVVQANAWEVPDHAPKNSTRTVRGFVVSWRGLGEDSESFVPMVGGLEWRVNRKEMEVRSEVDLDSSIDASEQAMPPAVVAPAVDSTKKSMTKLGSSLVALATSMPDKMEGFAKIIEAIRRTASGPTTSTSPSAGSPAGLVSICVGRQRTCWLVPTANGAMPRQE